MTATISRPVTEALERGYLMLPGRPNGFRSARSEALLLDYYRQARSLGLTFVILYYTRTLAHLTWNGDAVQDRVWSEGLIHDNVATRYPATLDPEPLADLLLPFVWQARSRWASLSRGGFFGGLHYINSEDGVPAAELTATWFRERLPPPESDGAFYARIRATLS